MPTKVRLIKAMVFPVIINGCESWTIKKAEHWRIDAFELWCWRRLESPLDCKEIKPVNPKGNQSWIFIGRTGTETEAPILEPPKVKSRLTRKELPQLLKPTHPRAHELKREKSLPWEAHTLQGRVASALCNQRKPAHSKDDPVSPKVSK